MCVRDKMASSSSYEFVDGPGPPLSPGNQPSSQQGTGRRAGPMTYTHCLFSRGRQLTLQYTRRGRGASTFGRNYTSRRPKEEIIPPSGLHFPRARFLGLLTWCFEFCAHRGDPSSVLTHLCANRSYSKKSGIQPPIPNMSVRLHSGRIDG